MEEYLNNLWSVLVEEAAEFTLTNALTLLIIAAIVVFRKPIARIISRLLHRVTKKWLLGIDKEEFVRRLTKPLAFFLLVVVIYEGFDSMTWTDGFRKFFHIGGFLFDIITKIYQLLLVFALARFIMATLDIAGLVLLARADETEDKQDDQIIQFGIEVGKIVFFVLVLLFAIANIFDVNISSLLAGLGIGGLALALAAKESLENLLGSFTIFFDKPFTVGDLVTVSGITGTVEKVGFRSTRIRTLDKSYVTVPNKKMIDAELDNLTLRTFRRVRTNIGLVYGTNIDQLQAIVNDLQKLIDDHERTNQDGFARFMDFGASSLDIQLVYYINTMDWNVFLDVKQEINFEIMRIVDRNGSDFAFPTQTIHVESSNQTEDGK